MNSLYQKEKSTPPVSEKIRQMAPNTELELRERHGKDRNRETRVSPSAGYVDGALFDPQDDGGIKQNNVVLIKCTVTVIPRARTRSRNRWR